MIEFTLEIEESLLALKSMNKYLWKKSASRKQKIFREILSIAMWVPVGFALMSAYENGSQVVVVSVFLALAAIYFYPKLLKKLDTSFYIKWRKKSPENTFKYTLEYNESEFSLSAGGIKTVSPWSAIKCIKEEEWYIFIYLLEEIAFIFPLKQLGENEAFNKFIAKAKENT